MSTVYIGNAVGDEHGKASGGEAGNQSGKELRIQPWYSNKKGWRIFRPISRTIAARIAQDMEFACNNPNIGYDQKQRNTLWDIVQKFGYDCSKASVPCECDCSALVRVCVAYGWYVLPNFNTESEPTRLLKCGGFTEITEHTDSPDWLKRGDILVTCTKGHTAVVLNDGKYAHDEPQPEPTPEPEYNYQIKVHGSVNVRKGNGVLHKKIATVRNCRLPYLGQAKEFPYWYKTIVDGQEGYITSKPKYTEIVEVEL